MGITCAVIGQEKTRTKRWQRFKTFPTTTRQLAVSLPAERTNVCVGADTYSIILKGTDTNDKFSLIDMLIPPGGGPMPHAHECEETFYVVEGEVAVFCHDQRTLATTGSAVNIPGWAPHVFHNLTPVPARLFSIIAAAGLEREFMEIGPRVATRTTPPPPVPSEKKAEMKKKMPKIAEKYNARILPLDTFNHLMSREELKLVAAADGE
jgi:mannose-6-phosphate isomerase-like protein (cupin superfamily)